MRAGPGGPSGLHGNPAMQRAAPWASTSTSAAAVNGISSTLAPAAEMPGISAVSVDAMTQANRGRLPRNRAVSAAPRSGSDMNEMGTAGAARAARSSSMLERKRSSQKAPERRQRDGDGHLDDLSDSAVHVAVQTADSCASIPRADAGHDPRDEESACVGDPA